MDEVFLRVSSIKILRETLVFDRLVRWYWINQKLENQIDLDKSPYLAFY